MISIASTASHLRMKIVVCPAAIAPIRLAEQAVTWNIGMTVSVVRGCGSGTGSPRRRKLRAAEKPPERMFDIRRSEEHTSELQSLMRNSYAVFCLQKKKYHDSR